MRQKGISDVMNRGTWISILVWRHSRKTEREWVLSRNPWFQVRRIAFNIVKIPEAGFAVRNVGLMRDSVYEQS